MLRPRICISKFEAKMARRIKKPLIRISNATYHIRPATISEFGEWYKMGTMTSTSIDSPQGTLTRDEFMKALKRVSTPMRGDMGKQDTASQQHEGS
jgi:hypothetical protein